MVERPLFPVASGIFQDELTAFCDIHREQFACPRHDEAGFLLDEIRVPAVPVVFVAYLQLLRFTRPPVNALLRAVRVCCPRHPAGAIPARMQTADSTLRPCSQKRRWRAMMMPRSPDGCLALQLFPVLADGFVHSCSHDLGGVQV